MNRLLLAIIFLALATSGGLSLLASRQPDGLEHTMAKLCAAEGEAVLSSPMPDYEVPVIQNKWARKALAGASGTLAVLGLTILVGWSLRKVRGSEPMDNKSAPQDS